ncbi:MAG: adenylyl-sulfate kinase [Bacteroidota bacterium]|nr:adenylyl-sulfate kinase [Bacteroidota bacterium]
MSTEENHIYPVFDQILKREDKEKLLNQRSKVIWCTGLSGAGKTTLAKNLEKALHTQSYLTQVLDGDNIRSGINNNLKFTEADRKENIRRIAEVSKLLVHSGVITINSFISPTEEIRQVAIDIIGEENFIEIFVYAPIEVCEKRDVKGLYAKARSGEIKNFSGVDSPFEAPKNPNLIVDTDKYSIKECLNQAMDYVLPHLKY